MIVVANSHPGMPWFIFAIGVVPIIAGILLVPLTMTSGILIKNGSVILVTFGRHRPLMKLNEIIEVSVNGACFEVRTKSCADKRIIPLVSSKNALLLAMLREYRPGEKQPNAA